ncbi:MAG: four helix bundle protein [Flavobacteriaceae bacterium]
MSVKKFEDLIVWQKAQYYSVFIYDTFKSNKDFSFSDQIKRASVSISNNIAEGFDRRTNPDFKRFLYISLASNSETRSMLYLAVKLNFISDKIAEDLIEKSNEIAKMLSGLIKSLK